jgi:hypothetical protein
MLGGRAGVITWHDQIGRCLVGRARMREAALEI